MTSEKRPQRGPKHRDKRDNSQSRAVIARAKASAPRTAGPRSSEPGANPLKRKRPPRPPAASRGEEPRVDAPREPMRIAKAMARAGLCSRRDAERWIEDGRVSVNGEVIKWPALNVGPEDKILVDGKPLKSAEPLRLWRYHKPRGLVTTHRDPEGRETVFDKLPAELGRVISIGRLDVTSEGLLLITNDGALARHLELPSTGWLRRYRVRAHGRITQAALDRLKEGIEVEGVKYGPIEATLDKEQGANVWLTMGLREGKNREVRTVLAALGLDVNRLIRISYGPFQLQDLPAGAVEVVRRRVLAEQLGARLARELGLMDVADAERARRTTARERTRLGRAGGPREKDDEA
ncbi:MAG: pseudouridine synthase [Hyphomicrobiaceae bacterium]